MVISSSKECLYKIKNMDRLPFWSRSLKKLNNGGAEACIFILAWRRKIRLGRKICGRNTRFQVLVMLQALAFHHVYTKVDLYLTGALTSSVMRLLYSAAFWKVPPSIIIFFYIILEG
ncbi:hypothetical protein CDAR_454671 [Caerostris darwini]|uniref:Uncharacterized protein n=1 Tax=Caerostris darwini TaxID=1538125 RepID=A0AAV4TZ07_9ARAC|nr:hypothetical protein CDAR_454671 [Caerostris darwini]